MRLAERYLLRSCSPPLKKPGQALQFGELDSLFLIKRGHQAPSRALSAFNFETANVLF